MPNTSSASEHLVSFHENQRNWRLPGLGVTASLQICDKADRYKDLQTLQGIFVPYSYGFYKVLLPDGYSVLAHVMEFVPTIDIRRFFVEVCIPNATAPFTVPISSFIVAVIVHTDPGISNMCLTLATERRLQFVSLDFTLAKSIPYAIARNLDWSGVESVFLDELYEELEYKTVMQWLRTSINGKAYSSLCAMSPDELAIHDPLPIQT